jgi:nitrous oxide reductase accessory protein NosL
MSKTTYYYVIDSEGFYPKQTFDDASYFDSEEEAQDIANHYGGRVLALNFIREGDEEWLDAESEAKVSFLEEEWNRSADLAEAELDF